MTFQNTEQDTKNMHTQSMWKQKKYIYKVQTVKRRATKQSSPRNISLIQTCRITDLLQPRGIGAPQLRENSRFPLVTRRAVGALRSGKHRQQISSHSTSNAVMLVPAGPCWALKVIGKGFKSILYLTGSRCVMKSDVVSLSLDSVGWGTVYNIQHLISGRRGNKVRECVSIWYELNIKLPINRLSDQKRA